MVAQVSDHLSSKEDDILEVVHLTPTWRQTSNGASFYRLRDCSSSYAEE